MKPHEDWWRALRARWIASGAPLRFAELAPALVTEALTGRNVLVVLPTEADAGDLFDAMRDILEKVDILGTDPEAVMERINLRWAYSYHPAGRVAT